MSGVLHPEGPEPVRTYWLRRVLVILALVILVLISVGLARVSSGATRTTAAPPPPSAPTLAPSPAASPSEGPTVSSSSPSTGSTPTPSTESSSSTSSSSSSSTTTGVTASCERDELQVSVEGKQMLKIAQPASFTVTVRNASDEACTINLARNDFELEVSTGKTAVWSSRGCSSATFTVFAQLRLDQAVSWPVTWDGRSATVPGCLQPGAAPKSGTYVATAQVTGAKAAKLPITLRK